MLKLFPYLFTLILLTSCGKEGEESSHKSVFRMNLPAGLPTLDPAYASDQASIWMCGQLYNGLVAFDEGLRIEPALAHDWEIDSTLTTYTFHLRTDARFHKHPAFGPDSTRRVTAEDVRYSFTRLCDRDVAARGFWIFNRKVSGLKAFRDDETDHISGFRAPNDSTFVMELEQPFPPMLGLLAMAYGYIVPREVVETYGRDFRSHPVGTGPFRFKSWNEGASLILLRNPAYFEAEDGTQLPYLDAVHVRFIREKLSEFVAFCQGELDFVNGMDKATKDEIFDPDGTIKAKYLNDYEFRIAPQLNTEFIGILVDTSEAVVRGHPLADRRVRQAMNYAIDRRKLVDYLLNGNGFPADAGMVPRGMPGIVPDSIRGFTYDPGRAARLLVEAGYPGGKGIPVLSLKSNPSYQGVMEYVQKSLERIGIAMQIDNLDGATLRGAAMRGEINLWRASWIADYPDPENYMGLFYSGNIPPNGANRMRMRSAAFDSLFQDALATTDDSLRTALYHDMENLMLEEAPVILLYYDKIVRIIARRISGLETNAMNMLFLKRARKSG